MKNIALKFARLKAGIFEAPLVRAALLRLRTIKPLVALALVFVLFAGVTLARAVGGGADSTTSTEPTPTPASSSPSPSPSEEAGVVAGGGGGGAVNNEVVVKNVTDGRFAHRAGARVARVTGGSVNNTNSAAAISACVDCRTVAVAAQAVLVMGNSNDVRPVNQAVAINQGCLRCHTYALAYQYVVSTGGIVHLTSEGQQLLSTLESQLRELAGTDLPFLELEAQVDAVVEKMWAVIDQEVVKAGQKPSGKPRKDKDQAESDGPTPSPSQTPESPSPAPSDGAEPDASPSASPEASESPSEEPSESPSPEPTESPTPD